VGRIIFGFLALAVLMVMWNLGTHSREKPRTTTKTGPAPLDSQIPSFPALKKGPLSKVPDEDDGGGDKLVSLSAPKRDRPHGGAGKLYRYTCEQGRICLDDKLFPSVTVDLSVVIEHIAHNSKVSVPFPNRCAVAVGFGSGVDDPTWSLYTKMNFSGLAVEGNSKRFNQTITNIEKYVKNGQLSLSRTFITPQNAKRITRTVPRDCGVLKMDIDGFDCHIVRTLLSEPNGLRPKVILVEVTENLPPPVEFSVLYHTDYHWKDTAFVGCSLGYAEAMLKSKGYLLLMFQMNNALFVHRSIADLFEGQVPAESLEMYRHNKPAFREHWLQQRNDRWVRELRNPISKNRLACKVRDSILCFLLDQRERAGLSAVPFRFCMPGCPAPESVCEGLPDQYLESAFWPTPKLCSPS